MAPKKAMKSDKMNEDFPGEDVGEDATSSADDAPREVSLWADASRAVPGDDEGHAEEAVEGSEVDAIAAEADPRAAPEAVGAGADAEADRAEVEPPDEWGSPALDKPAAEVISRADLDTFAVEFRERQEVLAAANRDLLGRMAGVEGHVAALDTSQPLESVETLRKALAEVERRLAVRIDKVEREYAFLSDRFEAENTYVAGPELEEDKLAPQVESLQRAVQALEEHLQKTADAQKMLRLNCEEHAGRLARIAARCREPMFREPEKISYPQNLMATELLFEDLLITQGDIRDQHLRTHAAVQSLNERTHKVEDSVEGLDLVLTQSQQKKTPEDPAQVEQRYNTNMQKLAKVFKGQLQEQAAEQDAQAQRDLQGFQQTLHDQGEDLRAELARLRQEIGVQIETVKAERSRLCSQSFF